MDAINLEYLLSNSRHGRSEPHLHTLHEVGGPLNLAALHHEAER